MHVYSWEGIDGKWDGTKFNGDVMPTGVYYYLFKVRDNNGKISEEKGSITLLR